MSKEVLRQCRDALETARNGLVWYRDRYPDAVNGSDDEASTEIDEAISAADAALSAAPAPAQPAAPVPLAEAASDVLAERRRQMEVEGWTPEHDDAHDTGEIAQAASCYARYAHGNSLGDVQRMPSGWPWDLEWWKPGDTRRMLVKAGALILAEIERLDRSQSITGEQHGE